MPDRNLFVRTFVALVCLTPLVACTDRASSTGSTEPETRPTIAQPPVEGLDIAPNSARVDLAVPSFSNPTTVTNPLFPVSRQESVLLLGRVDDEPFRTEVTLLPDTRVIEWQGQRVETLVSQYVAFLDGRIHEVAYDFYAQADDGSVWYFGEDVFNFADGNIVDTHGTWIAGKDGPAAMIMPADPQVGDVYRPENIPGFVFEEVTVKDIDRELKGPLGPIPGGLLVEELHMEGTTEDKTFAPGYGEFHTAGGGDVEALALAVPTDAASGALPRELIAMQRAAEDVYRSVGSQEWGAASQAVDDVGDAWNQIPAGETPRMIEPRTDRDVEELREAVRARDARVAQQLAIELQRWSLDLQLRYRPAGEIDLARFGLWCSQLIVDARATDRAAVNGDLFTLDYIRDRILDTMQGADLTEFNGRMERLQIAIEDDELTAAAAHAADLRRFVTGV